MVKKKYDDLSIRMKGYEHSNRVFLTERSPVIIRIDGNNFSAYTKNAKKPFDQDLAEAFWETCKYLAENIMGAQLVYHQSDEISILITNYSKTTTQSWFKNNRSKLESISASLATAKFNEVMRKKYPDKELAVFDARAAVYPVHEVTNYFIWRQQDAIKNSISMVAQAAFSHNSLHKLNGLQLREKLLAEADIDWNELPTWQKRGVCISQVLFERRGAIRKRWEVDMSIPIFTQEKSYVQERVYTGIIKRDAEVLLGLSESSDKEV